MRETKINYSEKELIIKDSDSTCCIEYHDILYIKFDNSYTTIHSINGERLVCYSLIKMTEKLPSVFVLCSRNCIVNLSHVKNVETKTIQIDSGVSISASRRKIKEIKERF